MEPRSVDRAPPVKRPRQTDAKFLQGIVVCVPPGTSSGIPHLTPRLRAWRTAVASAGGRLTQNTDDDGITHVLVNGRVQIDALPPELRARCTGNASDSDEDSAKARGDNALLIVDHRWLEQSLLHRQAQAEKYFAPVKSIPAKPSTPAANKPTTAFLSSPSASSRVTHYRRLWLGEYWHDGCIDMSQTELVLQAVFNEERSRQRGNEHIVRALTEMGRYERALHEDYFDDYDKGSEVINHRALRYARAASVVRGCAYRLKPDLTGGELPFVGPATAVQINAIIATGTCDTLEAFRTDALVTDSRGKVRLDSVGGRTRAAFVALPGVGQRTARLWWDLGYRTYEDVEAAAAPGGALDPSGPRKLSPEQSFSLYHRHDLLEGTNPQEVRELMELVRSAFTYASYPGWRIEVVGGERRGVAFHDADFLVSHHIKPIDKVILSVRDYLVETGQLMPPDIAMCRVQEGKLPGHIEKIKAEHNKDPNSAAPGYQTLDKFDHIYGIVKTAGGKFRRLDIIVPPAVEWGFAELGWIGSRTFLRFQRQHAKDLGMYLNSHALMVKIGNSSYLVPQEKAPRLKDGREGWPLGWYKGRQVQSERDVFELLGLPYREPHDRNCP